MSKIKIILIAIIVIIVVGISYWLISPLFITNKVSEGIEEIMRKEEAPEIIRSGTFVGADVFHKASGTATLSKIGEKYYVRLEDDFSVTNGPDLFVHLGRDGQYSPEARLGRLKGNVGSQNYEVPANINPLEYNEVWIWCRAFAVPFGRAQL